MPLSGVIGYYQNYDEDSKFSKNSRKIEFLTTTTILDGLIDPGSKILDAGAGAGAYSFYYAASGHEVTAVDLTPRHIEIIKNKAGSQGIDNLEGELYKRVLVGFKEGRNLLPDGFWVKSILGASCHGLYVCKKI